MSIDRDAEPLPSLGNLNIQRNTWIGHISHSPDEITDSIVTVTLLEEPFENWTALATFAARVDGVELRGKSAFRPSLPTL